jgi:anti-sigma factor RsiW
MSAVSRACPERELLLHGLADGELDAANAMLMEEHLRGCGGCAAAYTEIIRQKQLFRSKDAPFQAPGALRSRILSAMAAEDGAQLAKAAISFGTPRSRQTRLRRSWLQQRSIVFSSIALAASLLLFVSSWNAAPSLDEELVTSHIRSLLATHLTDVVSSDQHTVKPWFLGKLDYAPPVVDLSMKGFPLVGGRLDYVRGRIVAAVVYKRHSHVINLFVWPAAKMQAVSETVEGYHILSWTRAGFAYAAVSDINSQELKDFRLFLEESLS